jgi:hypothetical protein
MQRAKTKTKSLPSKSCARLTVCAALGKLSAAIANGHVSVIRLKQVEHVRNERNVLAKVAGHPFITTMVASFQSMDSLYMVVRYYTQMRLEQN